MIVAEQPTEALPTDYLACLASNCLRWLNQLIAKTLMIPLGMIMRQILRQHNAQRFLPCGQKTQTYYFPRDYGSTIVRLSSCIPPRYTPYSPPTSGNGWGGLTHELEAAAGVNHRLCR
jgi:hypothetical protein